MTTTKIEFRIVIFPVFSHTTNLSQFRYLDSNLWSLLDVKNFIGKRVLYETHRNSELLRELKISSSLFLFLLLFLLCMR